MLFTMLTFKNDLIFNEIKSVFYLYSTLNNLTLEMVTKQLDRNLDLCRFIFRTLMSKTEMT